MTLRALDTPEPLERFVSLTKTIRALETERGALKEVITEALQHEPPDSPSGEQSVDYGGYHIVLCSRAKWQYSGDVAQMESDLRALKLKERTNGDAELLGHSFFPKVETRRTRSEAEARERKATAVASLLARSGLTPPDVETWTQPQRDEAARRAGQRTPSEKTWRLVLSKLRAQKIAA